MACMMMWHMCLGYKELAETTETLVEKKSSLITKEVMTWHMACMMRL